MRPFPPSFSGFVEAIGAGALRTTTVVVVSEFSHTFRENGDKGTGHGHDSVYCMMSGRLAGRRLAGEQVAIDAKTLNRGRDLSVLTDYRGLIGGLTQRQFGLSGERVAATFPRRAAGRPEADLDRRTTGAAGED